MKRRALPIIGIGLAIASSASAQDAQTYRYDGNGRLVASTLARSGDGVMTTYILDAADNRLARAALTVSPPASVNALSFPYTLLPSQKLTSLNGLYSLTFETSGNLVVAGSGGPLWTSCTGQGRATFLRVLSNGDLALHGTDFATIWSTGTSGNPGAVLTLRNDGVAEIKDAGGVSLWTSVTPCD
ncbi:hypothetical protein [Brevundimonas sp.]